MNTPHFTISKLIAVVAVVAVNLAVARALLFPKCGSFMQSH